MHYRKIPSWPDAFVQMAKKTQINEHAFIYYTISIYQNCQVAKSETKKKKLGVANK